MEAPPGPEPMMLDAPAPLAAAVPEKVKTAAFPQIWCLRRI
jgi:hypothetical protein